MATASIQSAAHDSHEGSGATQRPAGQIRNRILSLLPPHELATVLERCEPFSIESKKIVWRRGELIEYVYFPEDGVISLVTEMEDGDQVEAMTVGSDGFAGIAVFHGVPASRLKAIGQISGEARRMSTADFQELTHTCQAFDKLLHRYSQLVFETVAQSAACNRLHVIEQRCARWLLMSQDRVGRNRFDLTQEFLAEMLGVRRPGVTVAMGVLEKAGLISHGRGTITVVDRTGLEKAACECYRTVRDREAKLIS